MSQALCVESMGSFAIAGTWAASASSAVQAFLATTGAQPLGPLHRALGVDGFSRLLKSKFVQVGRSPQKSFAAGVFAPHL